MTQEETQEYCDRLNTLITKKKDGFIDEVNEIVNEIYQLGGEMYWDRQIYIDSDFDDETMHDLVVSSDKVNFVPSDDMEEHPGIVVRYK